MTVQVPIALNMVTGFPNKSTDSQIRNARFPVLATLQQRVITNWTEKNKSLLQNCIFKEIYLS